MPIGVVSSGVLRYSNAERMLLQEAHARACTHSCMHLLVQVLRRADPTRATSISSDVDSSMMRPLRSRHAPTQMRTGCDAYAEDLPSARLAGESAAIRRSVHRQAGLRTEPLPGVEPGTPSLPWKCSTSELKRLDEACLPPLPLYSIPETRKADA